ncbi:MAG: hypothetical protein ABJM39_11760 [Porticoccus sp.]|uniref:hypothetical protein n=1 Tax=Porticoccus sp. TaxID=2024853 RepID=UPI00329687D7
MYKLYADTDGKLELLQECVSPETLKSVAKVDTRFRQTTNTKYIITDETGLVMYQSRPPQSWRMRWKTPKYMQTLEAYA